jgi:hypothetical protein
MPYTDDEFFKDRERVLKALDEIEAVQRKYSDVIAITDVVSLHDITEYRLSTDRGIRQFKDAYDRTMAEYVLNYFTRKSLTPEEFEDTIVIALKHHNNR